jgi:hypothetical protein
LFSPSFQAGSNSGLRDQRFGKFLKRIARHWIDARLDPFSEWFELNQASVSANHGCLNAMKPTFEVNLDEDGLGALTAADTLAHLVESSASHKPHYQRALALYNRSIARISDKVARAAAQFEQCFFDEIELGFAQLGRRDDREIIDYLELVLYSAAEHTDDLKAIARELAGPRGENPDRAASRLDKSLKAARDRISLLTNHIKHYQWRLHLLRQEFLHGAQTTILYGFSLNSVSQDRVKLERLPPDNAGLIALPSLLWLVLEFLFLASEVLNAHVSGSAQDPPATKTAGLASAVAAVMRLPNYTFDEEHTTKRVRMLIHAASDESRQKLTSQLYGAWMHRWSREAQGRPGRSSVAVAGDGVNRTFDFPTPTKVSLVYWDE